MKDTRPTHSHILAKASWEEHDRTARMSCRRSLLLIAMLDALCWIAGAAIVWAIWIVAP